MTTSEKEAILDKALREVYRIQMFETLIGSRSINKEKFGTQDGIEKEIDAANKRLNKLIEFK